MTPLFLAGATVTGAALVLLLVAERAAWRPLVWVAKPAASLGFIVAALGAGAIGSGYGHAVFAGLVLCFTGDVLLIPAGRAAFVAGLASFLAGHLAFAAAFADRGVVVPVVVIALAVTASAGGLVWRWLAPHVEAPMRAPVVAYIAVIAIMVACAAGTLRALPIAGATAFFVSDLAVARDRFVAPGFDNRAWGLPLYYAAVTLLALSTA